MPLPGAYKPLGRLSAPSRHDVSTWNTPEVQNTSDRRKPSISGSVFFFFCICLFLMVCSICNSTLAYGQFLSLSAGVRFLGLISDRGTRARRGIGETEQMCGVLLITRAEIRALGEERWRGGIHY